MNPKNALFLSASLTAFILAVLFGVVTKVTNTPSVAAAAPQVQATAIPNTVVPSTDVPTEEVVIAPTEQGPLGPEEAALLAAQAINRQDVYSVETFSYNATTESYKVVFSSGDIVFIGLDRQVLEMTKLAPVVVSVAADPTKPPKKNRNSNNSNNQQPPASTNPPSSGGDDHGGDDGGEHDDD